MRAKIQHMLETGTTPPAAMEADFAPLLAFPARVGGDAEVGRRCAVDAAAAAEAGQRVSARCMSLAAEVRAMVRGAPGRKVFLDRRRMGGVGGGGGGSGGRDGGGEEGGRNQAKRVKWDDEAAGGGEEEEEGEEGEMRQSGTENEDEEEGQGEEDDDEEGEGEEDDDDDVEMSGM